MNSTPWFAAALAVTAPSGSAAQGEVQADRAAFTKVVREYTFHVTPVCAPELVLPYRSHNARRDAAFVRSLKGTDLRAVYVKAVKEKRASVASTVYHCAGPPPPPPPSGTSAPPVDSRTRAIVAAQERLRDAANDLPGYFDHGDALFTRMAALRDELLGRKEP